MLTAEQVAEYLRQNPGFVENHVDLLMNLQVPHPHGGRAVSIGERQLVAVREKSISRRATYEASTAVLITVSAMTVGSIGLGESASSLRISALLTMAAKALMTW